MKRFAFISTVLLMFGQSVFAQTILELDFPKLSGDTAWIYSFSGSRVDSFSVSLDQKGQAEAAFPQKDYRGLAYLYIPQKGGGEALIAEPKLRIACSEEQFNGEILQFPESAENAFLRYIFSRRAFLLGQQEWLKAGETYGNDRESRRFEVLFSALQQENEKGLKQLDDSLKNSPLYAARFMELTLFMQRLYGAARKPADTTAQQTLQYEMQYKLDIDALYHAGNLWNSVMEYYPGLFVGANGDSVQEAYAASIGKTMMRLKEPVLTAFLSSAVSVCERINRPRAAQVLIRDFLTAYPNLPVTDPKIKRMLGSYALNKGGKAPSLLGLEKALSQPAILIFFDRNCDHCRLELDYLNAHFSELTAKGYRIVSIAADTGENNYRNAAAGFAWEKSDQLCDFKGFDGENFKNYGIIGTPTIFLTDGKGKIVGRFAKIAEALETLK